MRINIYRIVSSMMVIFGIILLNSCMEEPTGMERDQEQRYFDLYMAFNYPGEEPAVNGLYYIENEVGTGNSPDEDDWLILNYVAYTIPDDNVVDTYMENVARDHALYRSGAWYYGPFKLQNGTRSEGFKEGLMKMKEGGSATLCFTSELGYGKEGASLMKSVTPYNSLKYEVELFKVIDDIEAYEKERLEEYVKDIPGIDTIHDPVTDAIMYYIVDEKNDSTTIANDSVITVGYKGYLTDGTVFDESTAETPFVFTVGDFVEGPIDGWNYGLLRFKEGEKGRLFIPYELAYGEQGKRLQEAPNYFSIVPYEPLIFDIEVIDVAQPSESDLDKED